MIARGNHLGGHRSLRNKFVLSLRGRYQAPHKVLFSRKFQEGEALLDKFWESRGVLDPEHRQRLLDVIRDTPIKSTTTTESICEQQSEDEQLMQLSEISGIALTWGRLSGNAARQVIKVSERLLALRRLLGDADDVDLVWMIEKEPSLLTADISKITERLVEMKTSEGGLDIDVIALIQKQPSLLLEQGSATASDESVRERQEAWDYGLLGDGDREWVSRLNELREYRTKHDDCHIGFRDGDDPSLSRWAKKQRRQYVEGTLPANRAGQLQDLGFEFDDEKAEWLRWYNEIKSFAGQHGHCNPVSLASGSDFLLNNWCSVQRIARRSRRLPLDREEKLNLLGFDWTGADALS